MAPRVILYTGKGGVGKTSVAAATARACAAAGKRTIVLSTDPAHSLADALQTEIGGDPTELEGGLWAQQISAQQELERNWSGVQGWLGRLFVEKGVDPITADELTVPPGGDELFSLLRLKHHVEEGGWDVVVVDCAPTGETLRLLSFPDVARWWLGKVFGREAQLLSVARPLARTFLDLELPDDRVFGEVQELVRNLVTMNELLRDSRSASVRLVMTPDRVVAAEAMRTYTYLNLYGYVTDAVVVNRVFGDEVRGTYLAGWLDLQTEQLAVVRDGFAPVPVLEAPFLPAEPVGGAMLDHLAGELFGTHEPWAVLHDRVSQHLSMEDGRAELRLELPFARKGDVTLKKAGLELIVGVSGQRRVIALPNALADFRPAAASFADEVLVVTFEEAARV
jgi:arsenite/tail-anchored protein-transporting ATPase